MRFTLYEDFLALVFPQTCCVCKRSLFDFENQLCKVCIAKLPVTNYHLRPQNNDLKEKIMGLTEVNLVLSFLRFSKKGMSQRILHQLKYKHKPELGNVMGRLYAYFLLEQGFANSWEAVVPVPLHPVKFKRRGYNQSERFAEGLAEILDIPLDNALKRVKFTETQTNKTRLQRWENVEEVFELSKDAAIEKKRILLVDDVMTTGATLAVCANTLLHSGVLSVDIAVIAAGKS
ncbi:MAG: ComF family protein [Anditalea sp.]